MSMATEIWCAAAAQLHMFPVFHNNQGLAGGRYLILMDVIWFIIMASLTLSPSRLLPATALRCPQLPRKCRYLVLPHRLTLYTAAGGGGKYSEPCFCSNLTFEWLLVLVPAGMSCIALSLRGAITRGWKLDILGTSWAAPPPLHCAAGAGGANSPTYRYLSVKDAKENTLAGPGRVAVPQPPVNL